MNKVIFRLVTGCTLLAGVLYMQSFRLHVLAQGNVYEHDWNTTYSGNHLRHPTGLFKIAAQNNGTYGTWLFITDTGNNKIRVFEPGVGLIDFAGTGLVGNADGGVNAATFNCIGKTVFDSTIPLGDRESLIETLERRMSPVHLVHTDSPEGNSNAHDVVRACVHSAMQRGTGRIYSASREAATTRDSRLSKYRDTAAS